MLQQSCKIAAAERAQYRAALFRHESILAAGARDQRLMQMPAGREHTRQARPAHEGCVIAVPMADLLHGAAEQHHVVGGLQPVCRLEREFALARTELDFDRPQRQSSAWMSRLTRSSTGSI